MPTCEATTSKPVCIDKPILIIINLVPNFVLSFMKQIGIYAPFARDCSITILMLSIALFLLFNGFHFQSSVINRTAKHSLAMYLVGGVQRYLEFFRGHNCL